MAPTLSVVLKGNRRRQYVQDDLRGGLVALELAAQGYPRIKKAIGITMH